MGLREIVSAAALAGAGLVGYIAGNHNILPQQAQAENETASVIEGEALLEPHNSVIYDTNTAKQGYVVGVKVPKTIKNTNVEGIRLKVDGIEGQTILVSKDEREKVWDEYLTPGKHTVEVEFLDRISEDPIVLGSTRPQETTIDAEFVYASWDNNGFHNGSINNDGTTDKNGITLNLEESAGYLKHTLPQLGIRIINMPAHTKGTAKKIIDDILKENDEIRKNNEGKSDLELLDQLKYVPSMEETLDELTETYRSIIKKDGYNVDNAWKEVPVAALEIKLDEFTPRTMTQVRIQGHSGHSADIHDRGVGSVTYVITMQKISNDGKVTPIINHLGEEVYSFNVGSFTTRSGGYHDQFIGDISTAMKDAGKGKFRINVAMLSPNDGLVPNSTAGFLKSAQLYSASSTRATMPNAEYLREKVLTKLRE